ncbi:MAG: hypothetical protein RIE56_12290, partial [Amphiplicatus sp.]
FDAFVNYTPGYRNWAATSVTPVISGPAGPISGGDQVNADVTVDFNLSYELDAGFADKVQIYLNVVNAFDKTPPFYNGNTAGIGVGGWGFNGFVSNPIGRVVSLGARMEF